MDRKERVFTALKHGKPDRTPLFEIFQPFQPIHWDICGRTVATDSEMAWDAMAEGVPEEEFIEASAKAQYKICRFFGLDMVRLTSHGFIRGKRPVKTGKKSWTLEGTPYIFNERTKLVLPENPAHSYSQQISEEEMIKKIEAWGGNTGNSEKLRIYSPVMKRVREFAKADGIDWVYMAESGAGTGVAFYQPFMLMWMLEKPEIYLRWIEMQKAGCFEYTKKMIEDGCRVVAIGGDVSCDKGPFISPALYRKFILPVMREHVNLIHNMGAFAVYTSDGNHWPIKDDFFFNSGIDGYKEVDKSAGMTWEKLIEEGVADRICIIGNIDARYTMCNAGPAEAEKEVIECLNHGLRTKGGHILHLSHSVHEDVKIENYYAVVKTYRNFFGIS
ncbi:MAG: hypothetical protein JW957_00790 [Candidatus Omnitrophica bacterium]|nr:hypothetical protein [Candidatus Omnitrophota bacterium]